MANRNINARQQQKHDTSSNFNSKNATYLEGEILIESDTGRVKIADGDTDYKTLPYTIGTRVPTDAKFTDTTYTAGTGLSLTGTVFSITDSGVSPNTYGPSDNLSPSFGGTFTIPNITINKKGQITSATNRTVTLPAAQTLSSLGVTATAAELNKLDGFIGTTTQLNYLVGVTSSIQTQLNNKLGKTENAASSTFATSIRDQRTSTNKKIWTGTQSQVPSTLDSSTIYLII